MAQTYANPNLTPQIWDDQFSTEFFQSNPFAAYSGTGENNVIRQKEDFSSKRGNGISFEFITNLKRGAILDRQPLRGHEDKLGEYGDKVYWQMRKKGISMHELDVDLAAINLRDAARGNLKTWSMEDVKWEVIDRLGDVGLESTVPFASATAAEKNAWYVANFDRIRFGTDAAASATVFATAAAGIASTEVFTTTQATTLKTLALTSSPRITPIDVQERNNQRFLILFVHPRVMRDFKISAQATEAAVSVIKRNEGIFLGGDREWDGLVIHEVDDMPVYTGIGAGGTVDVYPVYLCGKEALGWAIKQRYRTREQEDDYGQVEGIGMFGKWGIKKLVYSSAIGGNDATVLGKQRGVFTAFYAASAVV